MFYMRDERKLAIKNESKKFGFFNQISPETEHAK